MRSGSAVARPLIGCNSPGCVRTFWQQAASPRCTCDRQLPGVAIAVGLYDGHLPGPVLETHKGAVPDGRAAMCCQGAAVAVGALVGAGGQSSCAAGCGQEAGL